MEDFILLPKPLQRLREARRTLRTEVNTPLGLPDLHSLAVG